MAGTGVPSTDYKLADPAELARNLVTFAERASAIAQIMTGKPDMLEKEAEAQITPVEQVAKTLGDVAQSYMAQPEKLAQAQMRLWQGHARLWQTAWQRFLGEPVEPVATPARGDKRFKDKDWDENQIFDFLKQSYLITAQWAADLVRDADVDAHTRHKARFYVEQIANALSPSNFAFTNPEVLRTTLASNGQNLLEGLDRLRADIIAGEGRLRIKQTDTEAFQIGVNLATTPGKVVFQNEVMQLIQYAPVTEKVFEIPLLIVPPWINKFYILDLTAKKSFIAWAVAQGFTVFVVSWINPGPEAAPKTFADYLKDGFLAALDAVEQATGQKKANVIGYCVGGSLVAAGLGYLAAKGEDRVNATTFFTTQVDFEKAGDLLVYVDEEQVRWIEARMAEKGYLPGRRMADAFNLLRSNDLIWSYVINNYMLGRDPMPFDLLYWNSDGTRMPAAVHSFYLRECYLHNRMSKGQMELLGTRIDLSKVKVPIYNLAAREDHIAPLDSVFKLAQFFGGPVRLVVSGSGHIAGVVNPPAAQKYQYWINDQGKAGSVEEWFAGATETAGSWWPDWLTWMSARSGEMVKARKPGSGKLKAIEDAPGSYVKVRGD